jgi:ribosomal protein L40E
MPPLSCSFCNRENPADARYCNDCGSPLHLALCKCGAVNNVTDTHCHRCGASVSRPRAPAQTVPLEAQLREDEEQLRRFMRQLEEPEEHVSNDEFRSVGNAPAPGQDVREFEQQPLEPMLAAGSSTARQAAPLVSAPIEAPRGRRNRYVAAAFVLAIAAAVAAGASFHDRYAPWLERTASALRGPAAVAPSPGTGAAGAPPTTGASPRAGNASTPMSPEPSRFDVPMTSRPGRDDASHPVAPIVSALQATDVPIESRAEGDDGKPSAPVSAPPAPDPRCPPAVVALALCERMAHADRR